MAVDDACLSFFVSDYKGVLIKQREYVEIKACNNKAPHVKACLLLLRLIKAWVIMLKYTVSQLA